METKKYNLKNNSAYTPYYVYALIDPIIKEIRYIGQSKDPSNRYQQHLKNPSSLLKPWFDKLKSKGKEPILSILESGEKHNILELEKKHINENKNNRLLNIVNNDKNDVIKLRENIKQLNNRIYTLSHDLNIALGIKGSSKIIRDLRKEIKKEIINELIKEVNEGSITIHDTSKYKKFIK
jgi:hypothetical protein